MRTGVFSEEGLAGEMNSLFASTWFNKRPDVDFSGHETPEPVGLPPGTGVNNVTAIFATPDGEILSAIPGLLDPAGFRIEVQFALRLYGTLKNGGDRDAAYREAHRAQERATKGVVQQAHRRLASSPRLTLSTFPSAYFDDLAPPLT